MFGFFFPKYWRWLQKCVFNACIWALQKFIPEQVHPRVKRGSVWERESSKLQHTSFLGSTGHSPTHTCIPTGMAPGVKPAGAQALPWLCQQEECVCSPSTRITVWDVLSMECPNSAHTALPVGCHPALTFWSVSALQPHSEFSSLLMSCFLHSSAAPWIVLGGGF